MLTRQEEQLLLIIHRLGENAYLVTIREQLKTVTGKEVDLGTIYVPLKRLNTRGLVTTSLGSPTAIRGGKAIKFYTISKSGIESLKATKNLQDNMWDGLKDMVFNG